MPNESGTFRADPLRYLKRTPFNYAEAQFNGVQRKKMKVEKPENYQFADLQDAGGEEDGIDFYVLGWQAEKVSVGKIGSAASFFYTGPLTGCTFAVDKNWYTPQVIHVNKTDVEGGMDPNTMSTMVNQGMAKCTSYFQFGNAPNITVVQSHNREQSELYHIFGWRGKGGWTFYQQVVESAGVGELAVKNLLTLDTWF